MNATLAVRRVPRKAIAALVAIIVLAAFSVTGPLAQRASALPTVIVVSDATELLAAVATVNAANGNDAVADDFVIELDANIAYEGNGGFTLNNTGGTDPHSVVFDGGGFSITCDVGAGSCGYLLESYMGPDASLTFTGITISGFTERVVYLQDSDLNIEDSVFSNNSITGGSGGGDPIWGGAIMAQSYYEPPSETMVTITGSEFINNTATAGNAYGGALYLGNATSTIQDSTFEDNTAQAQASTAAAGAVEVYRGSLYVFDSTFEHNAAASSPGNAYGGAIDVTDGLVSVSGTRFIENSSAAFGGAVYALCTSGPACAAFSANELTTFDGNTAEVGGGVATRGGGTAASLDTVVFDGNTATSEGGGLWVQSGTASVVESLFVGNSAQYGGALVSANGANTQVAHSTFTENSASVGGGAAQAWVGATLDFDFVTMSGNSVPAGSGDSYQGGQVLSNLGSTVNLFATVITDTQGFGSACSFSTGEAPTSGGYNFVSDSSCTLGGTGDTEDSGADPELWDLQDTGGPTKTMMPDPSSPLVNMVSIANGCVSGSEDQRGVVRPQETLCDIGAVESLYSPSGDIGTAGGDVWVRYINADGGTAPDPIPVGSLSPAPPAGVVFPYGALGITLDAYDDGWPVFVQIATPSPTFDLYKLIDGAWSVYPATSEVIDGYTLWTFKLVDGGMGDADGVENSTIVDPVAPGITAVLAG